MPTPLTLARDASGDLDLSVGASVQVTTTLAAYVQAHVAESLAMFAGEWYLDTREGIPYFRVIQERPDFALLRSLFRRAILAVPGVGDVVQIEVSYSGHTRQLEVLADIALTTGEVITNVAYLVPWIPTSTGLGAS